MVRMALPSQADSTVVGASTMDGPMDVVGLALGARRSAARWSSSDCRSSGWSRVRYAASAIVSPSLYTTRRGGRSAATPAMVKPPVTVHETTGLSGGGVWVGGWVGLAPLAGVQPPAPAATRTTATA